MADIDPAAVKAKHAPGRRHWCSGHWYDSKRVACEPYRLAEALAAEQAKVARVDSYLEGLWSVGATDRITIGRVTTALWALIRAHPESEFIDRANDNPKTVDLLRDQHAVQPEGKDRACYRCGRDVESDSDAARCHTCTVALADQPEQGSDCG